MKSIRFKYIFFLLFTLLLTNLLCVSVTKVKADEEALDLSNAYIGDKENYWALVNYGENYVGNDVITIFLDPEAINNSRVSYIQINEFNDYGDIETVYYKRGLDSSFASRFTYRLVNSNLGEHDLTLFLLEDLSNKPTSIIERIDINNLTMVRTIEELRRVDFVISREVENDVIASTPYKIYVDIKENACDYILDEVTYSYYSESAKQNVTGRAILDTSDESICNRYYFSVSENSTYDITIKDHFGYIKPSESDLESYSVVVTNFDEVVNIVVNYDNRLTMHDVLVNVSIYDGYGNEYLNSNIESLIYTDTNGVSYDIKNLNSFLATENGVYKVKVITKSGKESEIEVNITNIDRIAPIVSVSSVINIFSSDIENWASNGPYVFDPLAYVLATDNATNGDDLQITMTYYYALNNHSCSRDYIGNLLETSLFYKYLFGVNNVCIEYSVKDEAGNERSTITTISVSDNTIPTIGSTVRELVLEIGDDMPSVNDLTNRFGLIVNDNSKLFDEENLRTIEIISDLSRVDLTELNRYPVYISARDESGNEAESITLTVVVTERILRVNSVPKQYIVYGEEIPTIEYTCRVVKDGVSEFVPCLDLILAADRNRLTGELYITSGAKYVDEYTIYSTLAINSRKYTIVLEELGVFTIKPRTFKIIANSYTMDYKDEEPVFTWYLDTSVCNPDLSTRYTSFDEINYSCTFVEGDSFGGGSYIYNDLGDIVLYAGGIKRDTCTSVDGNCIVKYATGRVVDYYKINKGDLKVSEASNGGRDNYYLDFYGLAKDELATSPGFTKYLNKENNTLYYEIEDDYGNLSEKSLVVEEDYHLDVNFARFYILPKHVEVTFTNVTKIYGESDPNVDYTDDDYSDPDNPLLYVGKKRDDNTSNYQYEFTCFSYKYPIKYMTTSECQREIRLNISREEGEDIGSYKIIGSYTNDNYEVEFNEELSSGIKDSAYLTIVKRKIKMEVAGSSGDHIYSIFYEDALPDVRIEIVDLGTDYTGLANKQITNINNNETITFADYLNMGEHPVKYLDSLGNIVSIEIGGFDEYITGVGNYTITRDTATVFNRLSEDVLNNYDLEFTDGLLEVLTRLIYLKVIRGLEKTYGDDDPIFTTSDLTPDSNEVVEGNGHFILQLINTLENTTIVERDDYEPFDKDKLVYYLVRSHISSGVSESDPHCGEMVEKYLISKERYVNDTNYIIEIYEDYYFTINKRDVDLVVLDNTIEFNYDNVLPKFTYVYSNLIEDPNKWVDSFVGQPEVDAFSGEYRNNGLYFIVSKGNIQVLSSAPVITSNEGYWYINGENTNVDTLTIPSLDRYLIRVINGNYHIIDLENNATIDTNIRLKEFSVDNNYTIHLADDSRLAVIPRQVMIVPDDEQSKVYGNYDPVLTYTVRHIVEGVVIDTIEMVRDPSDFVGGIFREVGEKPGNYYIKQELSSLAPANKGQSYNFEIVRFDNSHYFTINKRDLTIRFAAANEDNTVIMDYGESLDDLALGYKIEGSKEAYIPGLCTDEVIEGTSVCDPIYDTLAGAVATNPRDASDVGVYTIVNDTLHIERVLSKIDVSAYYNINFIEATLIIKEREIFIVPDERQSKIYGDDDGEGSCGITYKYFDRYGRTSLIKETDVFSGCLERKAKETDTGITSEDFGEYEIILGTLTINNNYKLRLNSSVMYQIRQRNIIITAKVEGEHVNKLDNSNTYTMIYGNTYTLGYDIGGQGLANNDNLSIHDAIINNVVLSPSYNGVGSYAVVRGDLTVTNARNYNIVFEKAQFNVVKRQVRIVPDAELLSKIYGDRDPESFEFEVVGEHTGYSGSLARLEGENVGRYRIVMGSLDFGDNYDVILDETYFEIVARKVEVRADSQSKPYLYVDPELTYTYSVENNFELDVEFIGMLARDPGEAVGEYTINRNTLDLNANYEITYYSNIFTIYYLPITEINIRNLTNNQYQTQGEETTVKLEASFNLGADPSFIKDITWNIVKNSSSNIEFYKDVNNAISFLPTGSLGSYVVTASYNGITSVYSVYLMANNVSSIYISLINNGNVRQILGLETEVSYRADVHLLEETDEKLVIEWYVGSNLICQKELLSTGNFCSFTPNLDIGTYKVQARIGKVASNELDFTIIDNAAPRITLVNQGEIYYIEAFQNSTANSIQYIEPGYRAIDDVEGDISSRVIIRGVEDIDYYTAGTYYITYEVSDRHNHTSNNYRVIVVQDTVSPELTLNNPEFSELLLEYGESYQEYGAVAYDKYDGELDYYVSTNLNVERVGTYEVVYFAVDSSGNRGEVTRIVKIQDTVRPDISLIGEEIIYVEYKDSYKDEGAWFDDNYDGRYRVYASRIEIIREGETEREEVSSVDTSVLGRYYLTYYHEDSSSNAPAIVPIRNVIVRDSTPPVITLLGSNPYVLRYGTEYVDPGYRVIDNYDGDITDNVELVTVTGFIGDTLGTYYYYYSARDTHNNNVTQPVIRTIRVLDLVSPIIYFTDTCPQYITIEASFSNRIGHPTFNDLYPQCQVPGRENGYVVVDDYLPDLEEIQNWVNISGDIDIPLNTVGQYSIKYDVSDRSGNAAVTLIRYLTVVDTTPPTVTLLANDDGDIDFYVEVFNEYIEPGYILYDQYDNFHGLETTVNIVSTVNINRLNTYTITYIATDTNGNDSEPVIRYITVRDTVPPVVTLNGEPEMTLERGRDRYPEYGATAMDNYDGSITNITITGAPTGLNLGDFEVKYCAQDSSYNEGCTTRLVHVVDTTPPIVIGVEDGVYYRNALNIMYFSPYSGTDEIITATLNGSLITTPWYVYQENTYKLIVRDDARNTTEVNFVIDMTPPVLYGANDGEYINHPVNIYSDELLNSITYRINNGGYITTNEQNLYFETEGQYWVYATDRAGNTSKVISFIIDTTPPLYSLQGVLNGGITDTDVILSTEPDVIVSVNNEYIPTNYTFTENGYYKVIIRDLAGNDIFLQFVINKKPTVSISGKDVTFISQNNAIEQFIAKADSSYPRGTGFIYAKPLLDGTFEYISGTLFSDDEYARITSGEDLTFAVPEVASDEMVVAFIVPLTELNKFTTQTVEGNDDSAIIYAIAAVGLAALIAGFFYFFIIVKRKKDDDEEEEETIDQEDVYY